MKWQYENEVNRCLLCHDAPCSKACPNDVNPADRIRSLYFDNNYSAIKGLKKDTCDNCDLECEKACILNVNDDPIRIKDLINQIKKEKIDINEKFKVDLSSDICGVKIENPFLLSSSVVASNYEMLDKAFELGWAGAAFKTICTFDQHEASPRFSVLKSRTGDFYGFKNIEQLSDHAVEDNLKIFKKLKKKYPNKVIVASIMGKNEKEWEELARKCDKAGADVIELNFSCPNMEDSSLGKTIGQSEEQVERFTRCSRKGTKKPILAKLTPNVESMIPFALAAKRGGADGIAAINTIMSITGINLDTLVPEPSVKGKSAVGGYSGNAVKPIALRFISEMAAHEELKDLHYSGMGGIESWKDGIEFILLGCRSLQVTTAVMQYGYRIIEDLCNGLKGYMQERDISNINQLVGGTLDNVVDLDKIQRDSILYPKFNLDECIGCGRCYISCYDGGHQAIAYDEKTRMPSLIGKKCVGCHLCKLVCPTNAITTQRKRTKSLLYNLIGGNKKK